MKAWTIALALSVAACGGGAGGGAGGGFQAEFTEACGQSSNLDAEVCACMAEKAERDLSEDERSFVLASLQDDEAETARLRGQLGLDGAMRAGMFMTEVTACVGN